MTRKSTDFIVIHCSATPPGMDIGAAEIGRWHRARGWLEIGYHFVIRRDGKVELGRSIMRAGAHVKGYNDMSLGICLIGGSSKFNLKRAENNFTPLQWEALTELLIVTSELFPNVEVVGHRDLDDKKSCPSFDVKEWRT